MVRKTFAIKLKIKMPPTKEQQSTANDSDLDAAPKARAGRPRKLGKLKVSHAITPTGKGRGRPKKAPPSAEELKKIIARGEVVAKTKRPKKSKGKVGRPRKEKSESDDNDDEVEPARPVGRPPTGAINLNIVRTGRGQGRPKKSENRVLSKSHYLNKYGGNRTPGRPSKGGVRYKPTGKPRGRPKTTGTTKMMDQEDNEQSEDGAEADDADETDSLEI